MNHRVALNCCVALALAILFAVITPAATAQSTAAQDPALNEAIELVQRGDYENGSIQLDTVARRLAAEGNRPAELGRAYVYLSIAYLGLSQMEKARAQFLEAWKASPGMQLAPNEFPPKVLTFFEEVRKDAGLPALPPVEPKLVSADVAKPTPPAPKSGGGKKVGLLIGAGAVVAGGVALALGGGEAPVPPVSTQPPTLPTLTTEPLGGQLSGPENIYHDNYHVLTVSSDGTLAADVTYSIASFTAGSPPTIRMCLYEGEKNYGTGTGTNWIVEDVSGGGGVLRLSATVKPQKYTLRVWSPTISAFRGTYAGTARHP